MTRKQIQETCEALRAKTGVPCFYDNNKELFVIKELGYWESMSPAVAAAFLKTV